MAGLVNYITRSNPTPQQFDEYVQENQKMILSQEIDGFTPFSAALHSKNLPLALHIIEKNGPEWVNSIGPYGLRPLFQTCMAALRGKMSSAELTFIAEVLISKGADVNAPPFLDQIQVPIGDEVHHFLPKGATPLWLVLECTNSLGLAVLLRENKAKIFPEQLCSKGTTQQVIVDGILEMKKGSHPIAKALQVREIRPVIAGVLPLDLTKKIEIWYPSRPVDVGDLFGLFRQCNSLLDAFSSSLKERLTTAEESQKIIPYVYEKLLEIENSQNRGCYEILFDPSKDEVVMGNQTFPTLLGLRRKHFTFITQVDVLPGLRAREERWKRLGSIFWRGLAFAISAFVLYKVFQRLRRV